MTYQNMQRTVFPFEKMETICLIGAYGSGRRVIVENLAQILNATTYFRENISDRKMNDFFSRKVQTQLAILQRKQINELKALAPRYKRIVTDIHPLGVYRLFNVLNDGNRLAYQRMIQAFKDGPDFMKFGFIITSNQQLEKTLQERSRNRTFIETVLSYNSQFETMYQDLKSKGANVFKVDTQKTDINNPNELLATLESAN